MLGTPIHDWLLFILLLAALLALDLGVFHRKSHRIGMKEALAESAAWIGVSLVFGAYVYWWRGPQAGTEFLTGYLVEKSLSVDNIFVFLLIFEAFAVPAKSQHRVLYYGVVGALVMRAVFVVAGVELLAAFHAVMYVFGALLVVTAVRMLLPARRASPPEKNWMVRLARRVLPVADNFDGDHFWVKEGGRWLGTPLLLALVSVEVMDIVFAIDSVPAVLAITKDAFIVYSSNAFAILGLRALYFALAGLLPRLRFLHQGLAAILLFVGAKMILSERVDLPDFVSLGVVAGILAVTTAASLVWARKA
ncbi:MAG: TerC family protein [Candidatus Acidiferrales bacterium]